MEYSMLENEPKDEDVKNRVIEKRGHVITFTLNDVELHEKGLQKALTEMIATAALNKAKMTNIETHHPFILKLDELQLFTAHMYQGAKSIVEAAEAKAKEIEAQIKEYSDEKVEIKKQIPELAEVVSPVQVEDLNG